MEAADIELMRSKGIVGSGWSDDPLREAAPLADDRPIAPQIQGDEYDFYRCIGRSGCGRVITGPEMKAGIRTGSVCPCGGLKFSPINIRWYHWFNSRVLKFAYLRLRGRA